jgi:thiol-disulfide isomerase/thioredoxin
MTPKAFLFTSPSCGPCKVMKPLIVEAAAEADVPLEIIESDNTEMFAYWQVTSVPTLLLVAPIGYELKRLVGTTPKKDIEDFFKQ